MKPDWSTARKTFADGRVADVMPLLFGAQVGVSRSTEAISFDDVWHYDTVAEAIEAMEAWDGTGEPQGWVRNPKTGRRRPCGFANLEYVHF
jgi:hypothetical protein